MLQNMIILCGIYIVLNASEHNFVWHVLLNASEHNIVWDVLMKVWECCEHDNIIWHVLLNAWEHLNGLLRI